MFLMMTNSNQSRYRQKEIPPANERIIHTKVRPTVYITENSNTVFRSNNQAHGAQTTRRRKYISKTLTQPTTQQQIPKENGRSHGSPPSKEEASQKN
jgi:hypothetical protein